MSTNKGFRTDDESRPRGQASVPRRKRFSIRFISIDDNSMQEIHPLPIMALSRFAGKAHNRQLLDGAIYHIMPIYLVEYTEEL